MKITLTLNKYILSLMFSVMIALLKASPFFLTAYHNVRDIILSDQIVLVVISLIPTAIAILIALIPYIYKKLIKSFIESFIYIVLVAMTWLLIIIPIIIYLEIDINIHIPGTVVLLSCIISYELISTLNPYNIGKALHNCFYKEKMFINVENLSNNNKLPIDVNKLPNFTMMNDDSNQGGPSKENDAPGKNKRKRKPDTLLDERSRKRGRTVKFAKQVMVNNLVEQTPVSDDSVEQRPAAQNLIEQTPVSEKSLGKRPATEDLTGQRLKSCIPDPSNKKPERRVKFLSSHTVSTYHVPDSDDPFVKDPDYNPYPGIITKYPKLIDRYNMHDPHIPTYSQRTKSGDYSRTKTIESSKLITRNQDYVESLRENNSRLAESFTSMRPRQSGEGSASQSIVQTQSSEPVKPVRTSISDKPKDVTQMEERLKLKRARVEESQIEENSRLKRARLDPTLQDPELVGGSTSRWAKIAPKPIQVDEPIQQVDEPASSSSKSRKQLTKPAGYRKYMSQLKLSKSQRDLIDIMSEEQFNFIKHLKKSDIDIITENIAKVKLYGEQQIVTKRSLKTDIDLSKPSIYKQDRTKALSMIENTNRDILELDRYDPITPINTEQREAIFNLPYPFEGIDEDCREYADKIIHNIDQPIPFIFKYERDIQRPWLDTEYVKPYILDIPIVEDFEVSHEIWESFRFSKALYNSNCRHMSIWAGYWFDAVRHMPDTTAGFAWDTYYKVWSEADSHIEDRVSAAYVLENARAMVVDHREKCKFALVEMYAINGENDFDLYESVYNSDKITLRDLGIRDISEGATNGCFPNLLKYLIGTEYSVDQDISEAMIFRIKLRG